MIGMDGKSESGNSMLSVQLDDDKMQTALSRFELGSLCPMITTTPQVPLYFICVFLVKPTQSKKIIWCLIFMVDAKIYSLSVEESNNNCEPKSSFSISH